MGARIQGAAASQRWGHWRPVARIPAAQKGGPGARGGDAHNQPDTRAEAGGPFAMPAPAGHKAWSACRRNGSKAAGRPVEARLGRLESAHTWAQRSRRGQRGGGAGRGRAARCKACANPGRQQSRAGEEPRGGNAYGGMDSQRVQCLGERRALTWSAAGGREGGEGGRAPRCCRPNATRGPGSTTPECVLYNARLSIGGDANAALLPHQSGLTRGMPMAHESTERRPTTWRAPHQGSRGGQKARAQHRTPSTGATRRPGKATTLVPTRDLY